MPTYNPDRDYPPHPQDNPYFVQQYGYLQRPHPQTMVGIAVAVANECKAKLDKACDALASTRGPRKFNQTQYAKQRSVTTRTIGRGKTSKVILTQKCGPSYFPVG